ncbi:hypothetical protein ID866_8244 [Astraeus odoratus]|nr:hypothetical protein ID866_8244 [Astraeus odoratus]
MCSDMAEVAVGHPIDWPNVDIQLRGHTSWVTSAACSTDGMRVVSGSYDYTVRVWDAERGMQFGSPLQGHSCRVTSISFSPEGTRIVSGSIDCTVRVWYAEKGMQISIPLQGHTEAVTSVAFSPDGTRIVSGSADCTVRVLDAKKGVQIGIPLQGHTSLVVSVAFSSDEHHALCDPHLVLCETFIKKSHMNYSARLCAGEWVRGPKAELLFWVPCTLRKPFYSVYSTLVVPKGACIELDLSKMTHEAQWHKCFNGSLSSDMSLK